MCKELPGKMQRSPVSSLCHAFYFDPSQLAEHLAGNWIGLAKSGPRRNNPDSTKPIAVSSSFENRKCQIQENHSRSMSSKPHECGRYNDVQKFIESLEEPNRNSHEDTLYGILRELYRKVPTFRRDLHIDSEEEFVEWCIDKPFLHHYRKKIIKELNNEIEFVRSHGGILSLVHAKLIAEEKLLQSLKKFIVKTRPHSRSLSEDSATDDQETISSDIVKKNGLQTSQCNGDFDRIGEQVSNSVVIVAFSFRMHAMCSLLPVPKCTGVVVSDDGYIITAAHAVTPLLGMDVTEITIRLKDGYETTADVVGYDVLVDIAILKMHEVPENLHSAKLSNWNVANVDESVFAVGHPWNSFFKNSFFKKIDGTVFAPFFDAEAPACPTLLIDCPSLARGASGAPTFNENGELLGIVVSGSQGSIIRRMTDEEQVVVATKKFDGVMAKAIPIDYVKKAFYNILDFGTPKHSFAGLMVEAGPKLLEDDEEARYGALVVSVAKNSPADQMDIRRGDLIIECCGETVYDHYSIRNIMYEIFPNSECTFTIDRNGTEITKVFTTIESSGNVEERGKIWNSHLYDKDHEVKRTVSSKFSFI